MDMMSFATMASLLLATILILETKTMTTKSADSLHSSKADIYHLENRADLAEKDASLTFLYRGNNKEVVNYTNNGLSIKVQIQNHNYVVEVKLNAMLVCSNDAYGISLMNERETKDCPNNKTGEIIVKCGEDAKYKEFDFCVSPEFANLKQKINNTEEIANNLNKYLHEAAQLVQINVNKSISLGNMIAMVDILELFSQVQNVSVGENEMENFMTAINSMIDTTTLSNWKTIDEAKTEDQSQSRLLKSLETFTTLLNTNESCIEIKQPNVQVKGLKIGHVKGESFNMTFPETFSMNVTGIIYVLKEQYQQLPNDSFFMSISYKTMNNILIPKNKESLLNSLVLTATTKSKKISIELHLQLQNSTLGQMSANCVFWNFSLSGWDDTGCKTERKNGFVVCNCIHLTSYCILMSPFTPKESKPLDIISLFGLGVSIGSLLISMIIEAITWKYLTRNKTAYIRNVVILNIIVSLMLANSLVVVPLFFHLSPLYCTILTFLKHFFYLALFFWKLSLGLLLLHRLIFVFHDFSIPVMITMCFTMGYVFPIIIAGTTMLLTYPSKQYNLPEECWLEWNKRKVLLAFLGPMSAIIAINIFIVLMAVYTLLRPTIGEQSKYHNKDSFQQILRSIVILTPILGLTWIIGFPTISKDDTIVFRYLFAVVNGLQGFFIFIICFVIDKKVHDALQMWLMSGQNPYISKVAHSATVKAKSISE